MMEDIAKKYRKLSKKHQQEIDALINKYSDKSKAQIIEKNEKFKKKLLNGPTWPEEELKVFDEINEYWKNWKSESW